MEANFTPGVPDEGWGCVELPSEWFGGCAAGIAWEGLTPTDLEDCEEDVIPIGGCVVVGDGYVCAAWPNKKTRGLSEGGVGVVHGCSIKPCHDPQDIHQGTLTVTHVEEQIPPAASITLDTVPGQCDPAMIQGVGRLTVGGILAARLHGGYVAHQGWLNLPDVGGVFKVVGVNPARSEYVRVTPTTKFQINVRDGDKSMEEGNAQHDSGEASKDIIIYPDVWKWLGGGGEGVLLHGVEGVGKTWIVKEWCRRHGVKITVVDCKKPVGGVDMDIVKGAVLLLDNVDHLETPREVSTGCWMVEAHQGKVIGTARHLNKIHPLLRRGGRLGMELYLPPPDEKTRTDILCNLGVEEPTARQAASVTNGCVASDLAHIVETGIEHAARHQSALHRAVCTEVRGRTTFADIGGMDNVKNEVENKILWPMRHKEKCKEFGVSPVGGVLLFGPPGCAKTTIVKAIAGECGRNLVCLDAAGLFGCYVGESEGMLRSAFAKARLVAPAILFIDEIESVCGRKREGDSDIGSKVLTTLLNELDGVDGGSSDSELLFIGATNHPETLDPAVLRPGRLDCLIHTPPPTPEDRSHILSLYTPTPHPPNLPTIAATTLNYSGADLRALCAEACYSSLRRHLETTPTPPLELLPQDFTDALSVVKPSITFDMEARYASFAKSVSK